MRIALVQNDDFSMWHFFRGLITALISKGVEVCALTPDGPYVAPLRGLGVTHVPIPMTRFMDPLGDARTIVSLVRAFRRTAPDLVCNITVKPIVYGALAARLAGVRQVVGMVEGLGFGFRTDRGFKAAALRLVVSALYRLGCLLSDRVGFANPEDCLQLIRAGIIPRRKALAFRSMVGVDVDRLAPGTVDWEAVRRLRAEFGIPEGRRVVAMVTRVVWSKGVREFVEASEASSSWSQRPVFLLVGPLEENSPDPVQASYLRNRHSSFVWIDAWRTDLKEILALADVVTLPSFYGEGVPRVLLEAMALAKPIATTDNVGCREVVEHGKNGFLVPKRDSVALAETLRILVENDELREAFGRRSRAKAEAEFSESRVVSGVMTRLLGLSVGD